LEDNVQNDENANWRLGENGRVYVEKEHVFLYNKLLKINLKREKTELMENEKKKGNLILETIINLLKNAGRKLVIHGMNYEKVYGTLGLIALALVAIKVFTFYSLMGIKSNFIIIAFITLLFIYLLFSAFKNKWIPACIFAALSILMFADVTYNSFFNRYLSVGMLGAAGVVDDIGESIKEVMRPVNFIMLADAVFILVMLAKRKKSGNDKDVKKGMRSEKNKKVYTSRRGIKALAIFLVLVIVFSVNPLGMRLFKSVSNQEFFTFHLKDIVTVAFGLGNDENLAAWEDSYIMEKNGPLYGKAEGKNVIMVQIESLQDFVIGLEYNGQEITPNLNAIINDNATYFDNFYQQVGSGNTSDAEFAANNSIMGSLTSYTYKLFNENYFRGLPVQLKERGYETAVFHAHEDRMFWSREAMYPQEGFDHYFGALKGRGGDYEMTEWMGWGLTDSEFFPQTVDYMKTLKEPFYSFIITISNHHPYEMLDHYKFIELLPEDENTIAGKYLQSAAYTDYALGVLFEELKEAGLYDNALFVFYGDHAGLTHTEETDEVLGRILGKPYDFEEMMHVPFIIYSPDDDIKLSQTISTAGGQVDILPTIAYLMGFDELDTIYVGHNLYTVKEGFVAEQTFMTKGSFFSNDIAYEMSRDGVFENGRAWNIHTGEPVDVDLCYDGYIKSMEIINTSEYVLKSDAIRKIFLEGMSAGEVDNADSNSRIHPDEIVYAGYPETSLIGTNSLEALSASAGAGHRNIRLEVKWNEESLPYTVNNITGEIEMSYDDIIDWMEKNAGTNVYFDVEKSGDYLVKTLTKYSPALMERIILELPSTEEHTGKYEAVLDVSEADKSPEGTIEFATRNKVWALMIDKEDAEGKYADILNGETVVFINDKDMGIITKAN